ncbi:APC family permease [Embleya sp. NPDC008237]|uniref:APC family permease n=1 Tax=Embleya sp. NPDC008237 TaxID=3363978 RepID=UPI0036F0EB0C
MRTDDRAPAGQPPTPGLKENAIGLSGALMQSVTTMSPAITVAFTVPFLAGTAGVASPLVVLLAAVVSYLLGYSLAQLARHITSAGTYHSFVSRLLGPRWGFLAAWAYLLFYPVATAMLCGLFGSTTHRVLLSEYGWDVPWWAPMMLLLVAIAALAYKGVELAVGVTVALGVFEIVVMVALSVWGLFQPGDGGTSLNWLTGSGAPTGNGFFLGFVFSIYTYTGWDAAASLGEETANPRRNIPKAVLGSIVILGVFVVLTTWGQLAGWGTRDIQGFVDSEQIPVFVLAHKYWGPLWFLALLALLNSIIGGAIACMNASARFMYGMARSGALPEPLARLSRHQTPVAAIGAQTVINVVVGLAMIATVGLYNVYSFTGLMFTFALAVVYVMGSVAVWRMYRTMARHEFNVVKHAVVPFLGSAALILVAYESLDPLPESPFVWALPVVVVWMVGGLVLLLVRRRGLDDEPPEAERPDATAVPAR